MSHRGTVRSCGLLGTGSCNSGFVFLRSIGALGRFLGRVRFRLPGSVQFPRGCRGNVVIDTDPCANVGVDFNLTRYVTSPRGPCCGTRHTRSSDFKVVDNGNHPFPCRVIYGLVRGGVLPSTGVFADQCVERTNLGVARTGLRFLTSCCLVNEGSGSLSPTRL